MTAFKNKSIWPDLLYELLKKLVGTAFDHIFMLNEKRRIS